MQISCINFTFAILTLTLPFIPVFYDEEIKINQNAQFLIAFICIYSMHRYNASALIGAFHVLINRLMSFEMRFTSKGISQAELRYMNIPSSSKTLASPWSMHDTCILHKQFMDSINILTRVQT